MTPLGSTTWRLIRDDSLTLEQRLAVASSLWTEFNIRAALYAAEFAGRCFLLAERTQSKLSGPGKLDVGKPSPELLALVGDQVWDAGQRAWNILAALHASFGMGLPDPSRHAELQSIADDHDAVSILMFAHFGRGALDFVRGADPSVDEAFSWLAENLEELDAHLAALPIEGE